MWVTICDDVWVTICDDVWALMCGVHVKVSAVYERCVQKHTHTHHTHTHTHTHIHTHKLACTHTAITHKLACTHICVFMCEWIPIREQVDFLIAHKYDFVICSECVCG